MENFVYKPDIIVFLHEKGSKKMKIISSFNRLIRFFGESAQKLKKQKCLRKKEMHYLKKTSSCNVDFFSVMIMEIRFVKVEQI